MRGVIISRPHGFVKLKSKSVRRFTNLWRTEGGFFLDNIRKTTETRKSPIV